MNCPYWKLASLNPISLNLVEERSAEVIPVEEMRKDVIPYLPYTPPCRVLLYRGKGAKKCRTRLSGRN